MGKRVTMLEIADMAGVSQATVSLVLTNAPKARVADATRARVIAAARQLGYEFVPRLGGQRTRLIGLIINDLESTPFAAPFLAGATDRALQESVIVSSFCANADERMEQEAVRMLQAAGALGILYVSLVPQIIELPSFHDELPCVMVNCQDKNGLRPAVLAGDFEAAYKATKVLLAAGHRRVAHLSGNPGHLVARERERGFRAALASENIAADETLIFPGGRLGREPLEATIGPGDAPSTADLPGWTTTAAREAAHQLLARKDRPTAVFCFHDLMALACYEAAADLGLKIPSDLSIVGFDDVEAARHARPPLTTMDLPHYEMAAAGVEMLFKMATTRSREANTMTIHSRLISRGSVQRLA